MENSEQQLFLIEFLVDRVNVPSVRAMTEEMLPVTTCVSFQILNLPRIDLCSEESSTSENCTCLNERDRQVFRKGKSCLFALPRKVLESPLSSFPITMSVSKKLPPGVLPDVMLIGSHQLEIKDLINDLLKKFVFRDETQRNLTPSVSRSRKDTFQICTTTGQHVGDVSLFLRVTCFGGKIITHFQMPLNNRPYLFKGQSESGKGPVFQCRKLPSDPSTDAAPPPVKYSYPDKPGARRDGGGEDSGKSTCCPTRFREGPKLGAPDWAMGGSGARTCFPCSRTRPDGGGRGGVSGVGAAGVRGAGTRIAGVGLGAAGVGVGAAGVGVTAVPDSSYCYQQQQQQGGGYFPAIPSGTGLDRCRKGPPKRTRKCGCPLEDEGKETSCFR